MAERRFLVVRLGSLGDIVHTFPAVAGLRESFPAAEIVWLTHPRWVELVASSGLATEVWPVDSRDLASVRAVLGEVRARQWDAGIDYQGLWKAAFLPFLGGVSRRIGFSSTTIREFGVPILYTERVVCKAAHIAEQNGELSQQAGAENAVGPFGLRVCERDVARVSADLRAAGMGSYVVLSPGGGWRSKCWPAERFGGLCARIWRELGLGCVINYGPGEEVLAEEVRRASGDGGPIVYDGELGPLMALLQGARCIVGGDTGPLHLAVALGTRAVALFGPTDPLRNGPYAVGSTVASTVLRSANAATTYGRSDVTDPSLLELSVGQVFEAVKQIVGTAE
jgi:lipopolysaccharide heptosyltransferase I